jgi:hypothetical protein
MVGLVLFSARLCEFLIGLVSGLHFAQSPGKSCRFCMIIWHFYGKSGCKEVGANIEDNTTWY